MMTAWSAQTCSGRYSLLRPIPARKKARQRGEPVTRALLEDVAISGVLAAAETAARAPALSEAARFEKLRALHAKLNGKEWVRLAYGDVMGQIDPAYAQGLEAEGLEAERLEAGGLEAGMKPVNTRLKQENAA